MTRKVMIVDDSLASAKFLEIIISGMAGYEVVGHAKDASLASDMFEKLEPDVVFMDVMMPEMDGIEGTKRLRAINGHAKIIILSSIGEDKLVKQSAVESGADRVLAKPATEAKVEQALRELFE